MAGLRRWISRSIALVITIATLGKVSVAWDGRAGVADRDYDKPSIVAGR